MGDQKSSSPPFIAPGYDTYSPSPINAQEEPILDILLREASSTPISGDSSTPTQCTDQESQTIAAELHDDLTDETISCSESQFQPSPAFTFSVLESPTSSDPPSPSLPQANYSIYTPGERVQRRQQCDTIIDNFHRGIVIHDPFGEWADLAKGLYGGTVPPEFYLTSAPFTLHSLRGRARLRYIRNAFSMPVDATVVQIESFVSHSPSIMRYLLCRMLPNSGLGLCDYQVYVKHPTTQTYNKCLLSAIKQLHWTNETVNWMANLARDEDEETLSRYYKVRTVVIMRDVWDMMLEMEDKWKSMSTERLHARVVGQMRRNRPNSLLRNVVRPQNVDEESS